ncbi:MAG TPA: hypothetical protein VF713_27585 [Thermoanaerobaculia bacterium]
MVGRINVVRVNEQIDIGNDHRATDRELPIANGKRPGTLDFKIVHELVQLCEIDSSTEPAGLRMNSKSRYAPRRRCADRQPVPERFVDHFLERSATASGGLLKHLRKIVIERKGRSHPHIMMRHQTSVKMRTLLAALVPLDALGD